MNYEVAAWSIWERFPRVDRPVSTKLGRRRPYLRGVSTNTGRSSPILDRLRKHRAKLSGFCHCGGGGAVSGRFLAKSFAPTTTWNNAGAADLPAGCGAIVRKRVWGEAGSGATSRAQSLPSARPSSAGMPSFHNAQCETPEGQRSR